MDNKKALGIGLNFYFGLSDFVGSIVSDGFNKTILVSAVLAGCVFQLNFIRYVFD